MHCQILSHPDPNPKEIFTEQNTKKWPVTDPYPYLIGLLDLDPLLRITNPRLQIGKKCLRIHNIALSVHCNMHQLSV
jgi:hypothetical protein